MCVDEGINQRQTETRSLIVANHDVLGLNERAQHIINIVLAHAATGVRHRDPDGVIPGLFRFDGDAAFNREFDRITEQIQENLFHFQFIAKDQ